MFNFFKKNQDEKAVGAVENVNTLTQDEKELLEKELRLLLEEKEKHLEDARYFEQLGLLYAKLSKMDQSIKMLEKSLSLEVSIGEGYKQLMAYYNQKRKEAAIDKDDELIEYYMNKLDEMRNIAKKGTLTSK